MRHPSQRELTLPERARVLVGMMKSQQAWRGEGEVVSLENVIYWTPYRVGEYRGLDGLPDPRYKNQATQISTAERSPYGS